MVADTLLRRLKRFGSLTEDEEQAIRKAVVGTTRLPARTEIVRQGERPAQSCVILQGFAQREFKLEDGRRQVTAVHVPGDLCDLHSLLLRQMDDGIATVTECEVAFVPHAKLRELIRTRPFLARVLWATTLVDAAIHRRWTVALGRLTAYERVGHFLCEMLMRLDAVGLVKNRRFELPLTQEELADVFGLTPVHVNRTLKALRADGVVRLDGRTVTLPDWDGLVFASQFDPSYLHVGGTLERD